MIEAAPGATFESFLSGPAPTGLVGTLTWRLIDPSDGSIETAETTAGITEPAIGTYYRVATAPMAAGTYLIVWKNGSTEVTEDLIVAPGLSGARSEIDLSISSSTTGAPLTNALVEVLNLDDTPASVYAARTGGSPLPSNVLTSSKGNVDGYLETGSYKAIITHPGELIPKTVFFEVTSGAEVAGLSSTSATHADLDLKQDSATAATDVELAAEALARANADTALGGRATALEGVAQTVINVKDATYGAQGDGVTDDAAAIQAAVTAAAGAGDVFLPAGTYLFDDASRGDGIHLLPDAEHIRIRGAGAGATIIKLTSNTTRAFTFYRTADHQVFKNVTIEDLTVDCDDVAGFGSTHVLLGNKIGSSSGNRMNFEDIAVRRCSVVNMPTNTAATPAFVRYGIFFGPCQSAPGEATRNYAKRLTFEDLDFEGGNSGLTLTGSRFGADTSGYNMFLDDVSVERVRWHVDTIVGRGATGTSGGGDNAVWGAGIHIGQQAMVGRATVRDCYVYGSGDVAVEINNAHSGLVENCHAEECAGYPFYWTNYEHCDMDAVEAGTPAVATSAGQHVKFVDCTYTRRKSYCFGSAFRTNYQAARACALGRLSWIRCKVVRDFAEETTWKSTDGEAFGVGSGSVMRGVFMDGCEVHVLNINHTDAADAQTVSFVMLQPVSADTFPVPAVLRNTTLNLAGTCSGGGRIQMRGIRLAGNGPIALRVDGVNYKNTVTGLLAADGIGLDLTGALTLQAGDISEFRVIKDSTTNGHAIEIGTSVNLLINGKLIVRQCDFRNGASAGQNMTSNTNAGKVVFRDNWDSQSTTLASAAALPVPANNGDAYTVSGTADITSIGDASFGTKANAWTGRVVRLVFSGTAAATGVTDGSNLKLAGNFAYTPDDMLELMFDGTNWIEVGRSAN